MSTIVVTPPAAAARVADAEALPLGAAGLVDMHVRVDESGQQHRVVGHDHDLARPRTRSRTPSDVGDAPVLDDDRRGPECPARGRCGPRGSILVDSLAATLIPPTAVPPDSPIRVPPRDAVGFGPVTAAPAGGIGDRLTSGAVIVAKRSGYRVPMELDEFNARMPRPRHAVVARLGRIPAWIDALVAGRPYAVVDALAARAAALAARWTARRPRRRPRASPAHRRAPGRRRRRGRGIPSRAVVDDGCRAADVAAAHRRRQRRLRGALRPRVPHPRRGPLARADAGGARAPPRQRRRRPRRARRSAQLAEIAAAAAARRCRRRHARARRSAMTSHLTTHVLDAATGAPAEGIDVVLAASIRPPSSARPAGVAQGVTDADGRAALGPERLPAGRRTRSPSSPASTSPTRGVPTFYPFVTVTFTVEVADDGIQPALPRAAAAQPVRLFDLQRELDHERCVRQPRREQVRQGREPGRADLPRHRPARDRRPQRHVAAARSGARRLVPDGDNALVVATDTQKNTVFAFAKEHGIPSPEEYPAEARGALRGRVRLDRGRPLAGRAVRVGAHPRRRRSRTTTRSCARVRARASRPCRWWTARPTSPAA